QRAVLGHLPRAGNVDRRRARPRGRSSGSRIDPKRRHARWTIPTRDRSHDYQRAPSEGSMSEAPKFEYAVLLGDLFGDGASSACEPSAPVSLGEWDAGEDNGPIPPRGWLLGNQFCRRFLSSLIAPGGTGKTALRMLQYLAMTTGRPL